MPNNIYAYGHPRSSVLGTQKLLQDFISHRIWNEQGGRYHSTQGKDADVIVLSQRNVALGHFEIAAKRSSRSSDLEEFASARFTYMVYASTTYARPVDLRTLGVRVNSFGKRLSAEQFAQITATAGGERRTMEGMLTEELTENSYPEGAATQILVNTYERSPAAREACKRIHGTRCCVCEVDLSERYGDLGAGFIHVHHLKLLSQLPSDYKVDPRADLRPVCPNCHAMLHRKAVPIRIEELRSRLAPRP